MATSGFHLWQFQVFISGAEVLVVVLFLLDLSEIFFLATLGFEPGTSGSLVLHSTTMPGKLLVFISDNIRYLTLEQRDWWWYCSDWTCERFSFWPHWALNLGPLDLYSCTLPLHHGNFWFFISDNFRFLSLVQRNWWWYCSDWSCERFSFWPHQGFESRTSGSLVLHSTTVPQQLLVFISDNLRYLTLVQRDWWWYCSDRTCEIFSVWPHRGLNLRTLDL